MYVSAVRSLLCRCLQQQVIGKECLASDDIVSLFHERINVLHGSKAFILS